MAHLAAFKARFQQQMGKPKRRLALEEHTQMLWRQVNILMCYTIVCQHLFSDPIIVQQRSQFLDQIRDVSFSTSNAFDAANKLHEIIHFRNRKKNTVEFEKVILS
jgi:hypothetical protein